ncbi:MAG: MCE family protein [Haloechinothrix sp.]
MRKATGRKEAPGKTRLALRGAIGVAILVGIIVFTTVAGTGALSGYPEVTAEVPASSSGIREQAPVEYKGVVVGKVIKAVTREKTSTLTIRIYQRQAQGISAASLVRILPRTLFGDQYVALIPPEDGFGRSLESGDVLEADTSADVIALYDAYVRLTELLTQVKPEKISAALGAMAELLGGRGERFGRMIDQLYELTEDVPELLDLVDDGMRAASAFSEQVAAATPDGIRALQDAIVLSKTIVDRRETLHNLLVSGIKLTNESSRFLGNGNIDRAVELMRMSDPVIDTIAARPGALPRTVTNVREFVEAGIPAFSTGPWFKIRAALTSEEPRPYTAADCPRYPGMSGPNCGSARTQSARSAPIYGGTSGSVGSETERNTLAEIMRGAPGVLSGEASAPSSGAVGLLLGPLVRGQRVMVP